MICPKCGAKVIENTIYCGECGVMLTVYKERLNPLGSEILQIALEEKDNDIRKR